MKSTGVVRRIDDLGRIVLPIEIRKNLNIENRDAVEIFIDEDKVVLKKYEPACIFCASAKRLVTFHERNICRDCVKKLAEL